MKTFTFHTISGLLAVGLVFGVNFARAQAGTLDPTFGKGGTVTTIFTGDTMIPIGAAQQANGDIVVLSQFDIVSDEGTQIGLTRYTAAGKLDKTFGTKGSTITNFSSFTFDPFAFALEPNGKILGAGFVSGGSNFGLAQFTANGVLDTTFGTDGVATTNFVAGLDAPDAFLLQPNGQILMGGFKDGGRHTPGSLALARFNSNGTLDPTFGTAGVALVTPAPILGPQALALLSNGDYLAVGENGDGQAGTAVELSSTGELLSTVTAGTLTASSPLPLTASSPLAGLEPFPTIFESNGDYVVAQPRHTGGENSHRTDVQVSRFSETGTLDTTFADTAFPFGTTANNTPQALAVQSNGQVVVGGLELATGGPNFGGIARLDTNGELDTTFGSGGTLTVDNNVTALLIDKNGDILAIEGTGNDGIVVAAYLAN